jgi:aminopeptidase N
MNWFFDQWAYKGGHPEFQVSWDYDAVAKQVSVTVKQTQKVDEITPLFRTAAEIEIGHGKASRIRRVTLSKAEETFHFDADERPTRVCFDPKDWILKKLTFTKGKDELLDQLVHSEQIMPRVQAVKALAAFDDDQDVQAALAQALASEPFWGVRAEACKALVKFPGDVSRKALVQACRDAKSQVRREALQGLAKFSHDDSKAALRQAIDTDPSYYAVAEAVKSLAALDKASSQQLLLKACEQPSHHEVILKAAIDGLHVSEHPRAVETLQALLAQPQTPERRVAIIGALAKLKPGDTDTLQQLHQQLDNKRMNVRRSAIEAITQIADRSSIEVLEARRGKEELPRMQRSLDEAVAKVRDKQQTTAAMQKEVERLRKQNQQLEERLKKLEGAKQAGE